MRILLHRVVAAASSCLILVVAAMVAPAVVGQQVPAWPNTITKPQHQCTATGKNCAACPNASNKGCTSSLASTPWSVGFCDPVPEEIFTCDATNFDCGPQLFCDSGMPTGNNCSKQDYCS